MAKSALAGELRTKITVMDWPPEAAADSPDGIPRDADGYPIRERVNVFGPDGSRLCKWVNAYGADVYAAHQAGVTEPATLTMRWTGKITPTALIYRGNDPKPYEVISLNDVENRHVWLEIKVKRQVQSR